MNKIVIIGNGFDLYHGLPTHYNDFLFLAKNWGTFYKKYKDAIASDEKKELINVRLDDGKLSLESLEDYAQHKSIFNQENIEYLNNHIISNVWITYLINTKFNGDGWVDFEIEIYNVLDAIEDFFEKLPEVLKERTSLMFFTRITSDTKNKVGAFLPLTQDRYTRNYWDRIDPAWVEAPQLYAHKVYLLEKLKEELDELIELLRLYILEFVCPLKCCVYSEQIKSLGDVHLLNFNYTGTYKKIYGKHISEHHPVHGDCQNGDIVLGIPDDAFMGKLEYIYFEKYFQRIQKRTGSFYKEWIRRPEDGLKTLDNQPCDVFIMGHALANTDKGVLEDFFKGDCVRKITIFYHDQKAYESMVINLVDMFGKDFVIEQTGNKRIVFEKLKPAISVNNEE